MSTDRRIRQFKRIVETDPEDELGHFSLGRAYLDAGLFDEAAASLARVIELSPNMSKAHQLLGEAYDKSGERDRAVETMSHGVTIADKQGDLVPRDAMADKLRQWGAPVPAIATAGSTSAVEDIGASAPGFQCSRCGRSEGQLPKPPFKGSLGARIHANVCSPCWREWVPTGTKIINGLGLTLSTHADQATYDRHMIEFLRLEGS